MCYLALPESKAFDTRPTGLGHLLVCIFVLESSREGLADRTAYLRSTSPTPLFRSWSLLTEALFLLFSSRFKRFSRCCGYFTEVLFWIFEKHPIRMLERGAQNNGTKYGTRGHAALEFYDLLDSNSEQSRAEHSSKVSGLSSNANPLV